MVGRAGRSKACQNCKNRRVKCDETRPNCKRCIKAKLICGDWPSSMTVIQFTGHDNQQQSPKLQKGSPTTENDSLLAPFSSDLSPWSKIMIPLDEIFVNFTIAHLLGGWDQIDQTVTAGVDRSVADKCFLALATSYFGASKCDQKLVNRGFQRYGSALKVLNEALSNVSKSKTYDVLESVIVMAWFEMLMSNNPHGWLGHALGMEKLMELRGPESFRNLPDRTILQTSRPSMIFAAIVIRRPTILSQRDWKNIPWDEDLSQKEPSQYLIDILADCPELYIIKDRIYASKETEEAQNLAGELAKRTQSLLDQLETWKISYDIMQGDYFYETPVTTSTPTLISPNKTTIPFWTTNIQYRTLQQANAVTIYNACIILLLKILQEIAVSFPLASTAQFPDTMYTAGIEICRSVDYHLQLMRKGAGSFYLLFPLRMAWDAVGKYEPAIGLWLTDVLQQIQNGSAGNWALAGYLLKIKPPTPTSKQELTTRSTYSIDIIQN